MNGNDAPSEKVRAGETGALLAQAKSGQADALMSLLAREKTLLYDYLMRMTGQVQRSEETIDEVFMTMSARALHDVGDAVQLRGKLVKTVRKFSLDIWNANTAVLENAALDRLDAPDARGVKRSSQLMAAHLAFEKSFRSLSGVEREVLWLGWNLNWDDQGVAEAIFRTPQDVISIRDQALAHIKAQAPLLAGYSLQDLGRLQLPHPMDEAKTTATTELSHLIRGIRDRPVRRFSLSRLVTLLLVVLLVAAALWQRQAIESWLVPSLRMASPTSSARP